MYGHRLDTPENDSDELLAQALMLTLRVASWHQRRFPVWTRYGMMTDFVRVGGLSNGFAAPHLDENAKS